MIEQISKRLERQILYGEVYCFLCLKQIRTEEMDDLEMIRFHAGDTGYFHHSCYKKTYLEKEKSE